MTLFVTGGTGFLGRYFLTLAQKAGHRIFALRRSRRPAQQPNEAEIRSVTPFQWLEGDLSDDWTAQLSESDALVHFASAGVSPQKATWDELFRANVLNSLALWQRAAAAGVRRFIICGSCFEYGASGTQYHAIPPDAPLLPSTPYGASKAAASLSALSLAVEKNLQLIVLRPFHLFGEGQHEANFWPSLRQAAASRTDFPMALGEQVRDFMPVEDAAAAFLRALNADDLQVGNPAVENLGTGRAQTLIEFATFWWQTWGASGQILAGKIPYRSGEVMRYVPAPGRFHPFQ